MASTKSSARKLPVLRKSPTGIPGMDEVTNGGLPKGRPTLVCGGAGCGKTLFAMQFLVNGAIQYNEPGVFLAFEENADELAQNVASLGFDLKTLAAHKKLVIDYVRVERSEIEETGEYDLEGLFIRLGSAIDRIGAKRVVLDTLEMLFAAFPNEAIVRMELQRLFRWLKEKGVTAIITAERGDGRMTRYGLEEYIADCVILLDHRVTEQISTRRLQVVKYRGSLHGTNEYPFLIGRNGVTVLPITSLGLEYKVSDRRVSSGIPGLDGMLGGKGFYWGSSILVTGSPGTGKTSLAAAFVDAACRRGERCQYFAFEESSHQILRNMRSIGIDLAPHVKAGLLRFHVARPTAHGLELHLVTMYELIEELKPQVVVLDPITDFAAVGTRLEIKAAVTRIIDFLKTNGITALYTSYTSGAEDLHQSTVGISSLIDTWISLRIVKTEADEKRGLYILKSRGMAHSNQIRPFVMTDEGLKFDRTG